ncbi:MAG: hypothetical protein M1546_23685 [Chloroflexi bacterium]|nr:hypothetical protein [Chloroflexota bacterium]
MKTTAYFDNEVLVKRPYLKMEWIEAALRAPIRKQRQKDGRYRLWVYVAERDWYLRVVTLADGETVHNAFPDRDFVE